ncbi:ADP-heptose:LPS heptosyltransferase [Anaerovibrio lipolyticus DSM 3074]|uniref:ADP-heptose:LPS heptosyltransferase n=1 Tax=Anaerovibrio lipolyticus DSM 3074 TaxID=1120997 RepID=A0A1M6AMP9_9FIRM|nr:hypothetical protein [Anaerovibrio lipolyticus]SHI37789.1 ADP-heptose:LPS heptosyltransferase [Anaerovibrio lipolyticus DSM 3074]
MWKYLFPFGKITQGSNIVIYGAGVIGNQYIEQLRATNYANIVAVADREWQKFEVHDIKMVAPEKLIDLSFDKVMIAIKNDSIRNKVATDLVQTYCVPNSKIVSDSPIFSEKSAILSVYNKAPVGASCFSNAISLAVLLGKGLGDAIISKRFIHELIKEFGNAISLDLYVDGSIYDFIKVLFSDEEGINQINSNETVPFTGTCYNYDLAFYPGYILQMYHVNHESIQKKNSRFASKINQLLTIINDEYLDNTRVIENNVLFSRCKKKGINAYTSYAFDGLFPINDTKVHIPLCEEYKEKFQKLKLPDRYITINFGWGYNGHEDDNKYIPNKIWPIKRYEEFLSLFKLENPNISVVQLGMKESYHIKGADRYVFGENIETVKYILQDSSLHLDCEGGLVHIATQLGTRCAVLFGPTPVHFFGYPQNINIVSKVCSECYYLDTDFSVCYRRLDRPECMWGITAEQVMEAIKDQFIS